MSHNLKRFIENFTKIALNRGISLEIGSFRIFYTALKIAKIPGRYGRNEKGPWNLISPT